MKTIEFKTHLNKANAATVDQWLVGLRRIWNMGLEILDASQQLYWQSQLINADGYERCATLKWVVNDIGADKPVFGLACDIVAESSRRWGKKDQVFESPHRDYRPACSITPSLLKEELVPAIGNIGKNSHIGLCKIFAAKNHRDKLWLTDIPNVFIRGLLKSLAKAWEEYRKGKRDSPRYKGGRNPIKSLICEDCDGAVALKNNQIRLPKIGWLTCKTLGERWNSNVSVRVAKLCLRPSGVYIQLTGSVPSKPVKPSNISCGLDVGLQFITADDIGKTVKPPKYYRESEKRLKRLQRQLSRRTRGSKNAEKLKQKLARTHEKIANQRRLFNHKISSSIVQTFGAIAVEDIKLANLKRRPKPIETEEGSGKWKRNNAAAKSGLNKSFADAGLGQLISFIEVKSKVAEREFVKVSPAYTSQDCPNCGNRQKKALSQRTHQCQQCGFTTARDHAAAINIKAKANFSNQYRTELRELENESSRKPVDRPSGGMKQEGLQKPLGDDIATLQSFFPIQLELTLDLPFHNASGDFEEDKTSEKTKKESKPRNQASKPKRCKDSNKGGTTAVVGS